MARRWAIALLLLATALPLGAAQSRTERMVAPGVRHLTITRDEGPWVIHVLECDRREPWVAPAVALAQGKVVGLSPLGAMAGALRGDDRYPVALVNGDFFSMDSADPFQGDPLGLYIQDGELVSAPSERCSLVLGANGELAICRPTLEAWVEHPQAGRFAVSGLNQSRPPGRLVLYTPRFDATTRCPATGMEVTLGGLAGPLGTSQDCELAVTAINQAGNSPIPRDGVVLSGWGPAGDYLGRLALGDRLRLHVALAGAPVAPRSALAGGPLLLRDGKPSTAYAEESFKESFATTRHPRTAIGFNSDKLYLVTVDGRQQGRAGMTLGELTALMAELGCGEAMNLDGGGSTELWLRGRVANSPSDGRERAVANALALVCTAPVGPPHHVVLPAETLEALAGHAVTLEAEVEDQYYNPLAAPVQWRCARELGKVEGNRLVPGQGEGMVIASCEGITAGRLVSVLAAPSAVLLERDGSGPVVSGQQVGLRVRALGPSGRELPLDGGRVQWQCRGGKMEGGTFTAGDPGEATVTASVNGVAANLAIPVGQAGARLLEGFEGTGSWSFAGSPAAVTGSVSALGEAAHQGKKALALDYSLPAGTGTQVAQARLHIPLGSASAFALWVRGDGSGLWLRARLRDTLGKTANVDLAAKVDWEGQWKKLAAAVPAELKPPVRLESVYLADLHPVGKAGRVLLDEVTAETIATPSARRQGMAVPRYVVKRTEEPMAVDGLLTEPVWKRLEAISLVLSDGSGTPQQETEVKLCWDDGHLYVAFTAIDTDIWGTMTRRDQPLFDEEVVEIFLSPTGSLTDYYELEVSPRNVVWDGKVHNPEGRWQTSQADASWDCPGLLTGVRVVGTLANREDLDQLWTVEMGIPFAPVAPGGRAPRPGDEWRANLFRIDRGEVDEFSAWSPTRERPAHFHVPRCFGHLVFGDEKA